MVQGEALEGSGRGLGGPPERRCRQNCHRARSACFRCYSHSAVQKRRSPPPVAKRVRASRLFGSREWDGNRQQCHSAIPPGGPWGSASIASARSSDSHSVMSGNAATLGQPPRRPAMVQQHQTGMGSALHCGILRAARAPARSTRKVSLPVGSAMAGRSPIGFAYRASP